MTDSSADDHIPIDTTALLDTVPCGIISFSDSGAVQFANAVLLDHLRLSRQDLIGSNISSILSAGDRIFYQTHLFPMLRLHGRVDEIFLTFKGGEGRELPVLVNAVRRPHEDAFLNHGVVIPVHRRQKFETELLQARKRAEDALQSNETLMESQRALESRTRDLDRRLSRIQHQNAELRRLNRIMAHDLREPLRKMATFADILAAENREELSSSGSDALDRVLASSDRMNDLLSRLQEYLALDSAGEPLTMVNLNNVLESAVETVKRNPEHAGIVITCGSLPKVEGFRRQLVALFTQLFDNAMKFRSTDREPRVKVECAVVQQNSYRSVAEKYRYVDHARITIIDNGMGFEPRFKDYVFEILKKLDADSPGLGMGLAICKKIVANHYGSIMIESEPGAGTTVTVTLPLTQEGV